MKSITKSSISVLSLFIVAMLFSCSNDSESPSSTGQASVSMTDARVDAENVSSVNLSISEIQAISNGEVKTIATFNSPRQFNLMAYQNGDTYTFGSGEIEVGSYSELRFIISGESDSYLEMKDGSREDLEIPSGTSSGYKVKGSFEVDANSTTSIVADIDLRKALVVTGEGTYKLRPTARLIVEENTGIITGSVEGQLDTNEEVVVYAYSAGTFQPSEEEAPGQGKTRFEGSINSAVVAEDGTYTLAFMEEGDYELVVVSYVNEDEDEDLEYQGRLSAEFLLDGSLLNTISVSSETTINVDLLLQ